MRPPLSTPVHPAPSIPRTGSTARNRNALSLPLLVFTGLCLVQVPGGSSGDRGWPGPGRPPWGMGWGRGARGCLPSRAAPLHPARVKGERTGPPRVSLVALPVLPSPDGLLLKGGVDPPPWGGPAHIPELPSTATEPSHTVLISRVLAAHSGLPGAPSDRPGHLQRSWGNLTHAHRGRCLVGGKSWGDPSIYLPVNLHAHTSCLQIKPMPVSWFQTGIQLLAPSKL